MKVVCTSNKLTEELAQTYQVPSSDRPEYPLSVGRLYTVLAITQLRENQVYGDCSLLSLVNDNGALSIVPAYLFRIESAEPTPFWRAYIRDGLVSLAHPTLSNEYFSDDLSNDISEAVERWNAIKVDMSRPE